MSCNLFYSMQQCFMCVRFQCSTLLFFRFYSIATELNAVLIANSRNVDSTHFNSIICRSSKCCNVSAGKSLRVTFGFVLVQPCFMTKLSMLVSVIVVHKFGIVLQKCGLICRDFQLVLTPTNDIVYYCKATTFTIFNIESCQRRRKCCRFRSILTTFGECLLSFSFSLNQKMALRLYLEYKFAS